MIKIILVVISFIVLRNVCKPLRKKYLNNKLDKTWRIWTEKVEEYITGIADKKFNHEYSQELLRLIRLHNLTWILFEANKKGKYSETKRIINQNLPKQTTAFLNLHRELMTSYGEKVLPLDELKTIKEDLEKKAYYELNHIVISQTLLN